MEGMLLIMGSMFRKPSTKRIGLKVLVLGETGVGKSVFALSFPEIMALDSETGIALYEGTEQGKNLLGVANTQDFNELQEAIEEIEDMVEEDDGAVKSFVVDSETKYFQNLNDAVLSVEEKRARKNNKDVNDTNVSMRGYGRIKNIGIRMQNLKIDLSAKGVNVISIAQIEDVKTKIGDQFVVTGYKPIMAKNSNYDYDLIIKLFVEENGDKISYKGLIEKDRTGVTKKKQIVDNPSFDIWKDYLESRATGDKISSDLSKDSDKAKESFEETLEQEEKAVTEKLKEAMNKSPEAKAKALELIKEKGIKNPLQPKDDNELKIIEAIVKTIESL